MLEKKQLKIKKKKKKKKKKREENMYVRKTGLSLNFVIVNWLEALESGIWKK